MAKTPPKQRGFGPVIFMFLLISGALWFTLWFWYHTKYVSFFKVSETGDKIHLGGSVGRHSWQRNRLLTLKWRGGEDLVKHSAADKMLPRHRKAGQIHGSRNVRYTSFCLGFHSVCWVGVTKSTILLGSHSRILPLTGSYSIFKGQICCYFHQAPAPHVTEAHPVNFLVMEMDTLSGIIYFKWEV